MGELSQNRHWPRPSPTTGFAAAYGLFESGWVRIDRQTLPLCPAARSRSTASQSRSSPTSTTARSPRSITSPQSSARRSSCDPDLIVLGGDYSLQGREVHPPVPRGARRPAGPVGVFGVLGNHDYWHGVAETRRAEGRRRSTELTNRGVWLSARLERFRLAGVDDLWTGRADVHGGARRRDARRRLPAGEPQPGRGGEVLRDPRVGLGAERAHARRAGRVPDRRRRSCRAATGRSICAGWSQAPETLGVRVARPGHERRAGPRRQPAGDQPHHAESGVSRRRLLVMTPLDRIQHRGRGTAGPRRAKGDCRATVVSLPLVPRNRHPAAALPELPGSVVLHGFLLGAVLGTVPRPRRPVALRRTGRSCSAPSAARSGTVMAITLPAGGIPARAAEWDGISLYGIGTEEDEGW